MTDPSHWTYEDLRAFALANPEIDPKRWRSDAAYRTAILRVLAQTAEGRAAIVRAMMRSVGGAAGERRAYSYSPTVHEANAGAIIVAGLRYLWAGARAVAIWALRHPVATTGLALAVEAAVSLWRGDDPELVRLYRAARDAVISVGQTASAAGSIATGISRHWPLVAGVAGLYFLTKLLRRKK